MEAVAGEREKEDGSKQTSVPTTAALDRRLELREVDVTGQKKTSFRFEAQRLFLWLLDNLAKSKIRVRSMISKYSKSEEMSTEKAKEI